MSLIRGIRRRVQAINPLVEVRPNFFIVGAGKSGTTFLHWQLAQHPDIFMSVPKEPNYLAFKNSDKTEFGPNDLRYFENSITDCQNYLGLFQRAIEKVIGESSPIYLTHPSAAGNIKDFSRQAKILMVLRSPVQVLFSAWKHAHRLGYEKEDLRTAVSRIDPPNRYSTGNYLEKVNYGPQVLRYLNVFDREKIKILLFEEMVGSPQTILLDILEWLEVDADFQFTDLGPMNVDRSEKKLESADREFLFSKVEQLIDNAETVLKMDLGHWKI